MRRAEFFRAKAESTIYLVGDRAPGAPTIRRAKVALDCRGMTPQESEKLIEAARTALEATFAALWTRKTWAFSDFTLQSHAHGRRAWRRAVALEE
jgi:hypothetical protein